MTTADERRTRLRHAGILVLVAGLCVGGFLFWRASRIDPADSDEAVLSEQQSSRAYELQVQKNVGALGLLMSRWSDELGSPSAVAVEVMLVAALTAGVCFLLAAYPPPGVE